MRLAVSEGRREGGRHALLRSKHNTKPVTTSPPAIARHEPGFFHTIAMSERLVVVLLVCLCWYGLEAGAPSSGFR